jgi:hypothetical protein
MTKEEMIKEVDTIVSEEDNHFKEEIAAVMIIIEIITEVNIL